MKRIARKILVTAMLFGSPLVCSDVPTVKLTPKIRTEVMKNTENLLTPELKLHLTSSLILDNKKQFEEAPHIFAESEGQEEGGTGTVIFVRGLKQSEEGVHSIYGTGKAYKHPVTNENLGYEIIPVGDATVIKTGETAELLVTKALVPIEVGMRIFPAYALTLPTKIRFIPAEKNIGEGYILAGHQAMDGIGKNYTVVLSVGQRDGVVEGNYLDIYQSGKIVADPNNKSWRRKTIQLPDKRIGKLLVYQVYEKLSLAIVTESTEVIYVLDKVKAP